PAATSTIFLIASVRQPAGIVAGELPRHPPGTRTAHQRPLQGLLAGTLDGLRLEAEDMQPVRDDPQVFILAERIEGHPQTEALGQRDLLLGGLARMDL